MKRNLWLIALVLVFSALLAKEFARPVLAQVRAALVQDVDEPGRNILVISGASANNFPSFADFQVPAGKRYVIEQYTADCLVDNTGTVSNIQLSGQAGSANTLSSVVPHFVSNSPGTFNGHVVNEWVGTGNGPFYADPGTFIHAAADSPTNVIRICSFFLSGHIVSNP